MLFVTKLFKNNYSKRKHIMETNDKLDPKPKEKNQDTKDQKNAKRKKNYGKNKEKNILLKNN